MVRDRFSCSVCRFRAVPLLVGWLIFSSFPAEAQGERLEFFIVQYPSQLILYNKYEQKISFDKLRQLPEYLPVKILERNVYLSDGFTPVMKGEINGELIYIATDETGETVNSDLIGYHRFFRNCLPVNDTVVVITSQTVFLAKRPTFANSGESEKRFLEPGDKLRRLFRWRNWTYVEKTGRWKEYGWSYLSSVQENRSWQMVEPVWESTDTRFSRIVQEVERELNEVNILLEQLFSRLSRSTGHQLSPPYWRMEVWEEQINGYRDNASDANAFSESTRLLVNRLQNIVQGTPYRVTLRDGVIIIRK